MSSSPRPPAAGPSFFGAPNPSDSDPLLIRAIARSCGTKEKPIRRGYIEAYFFFFFCKKRTTHLRKLG